MKKLSKEIGVGCESFPICAYDEALGNVSDETKLEFPALAPRPFWSSDTTIFLYFHVHMCDVMNTVLELQIQGVTYGAVLRSYQVLYLTCLWICFRPDPLQRTVQSGTSTDQSGSVR